MTVSSIPERNVDMTDSETRLRRSMPYVPQFDSEIIHDLARDFSLDERLLRQTLDKVVDQYGWTSAKMHLRRLDSHNVSSLRQFEQALQNTCRHLAAAFKSLRQTVDCWEEQDDETRHLVEHFLGTTSRRKLKRFEEALNFAPTLDRCLVAATEIGNSLERYKRFVNRGRGSSRRGRHQRAADLTPLEETAKILKEFWEFSTNTRFSQNFRSGRTDLGEAGNELIPANAASRFFLAVASKLNAEYRSKNCKTIMRKLQIDSGHAHIQKTLRAPRIK
jgi:hypothetical protein